MKSIHHPHPAGLFISNSHAYAQLADWPRWAQETGFRATFFLTLGKSLGKMGK